VAGEVFAGFFEISSQHRYETVGLDPAEDCNGLDAQSVPSHQLKDSRLRWPVTQPVCTRAVQSSARMVHRRFTRNKT